MEQPTIDEEKKKREAATSASGGVIASPQTISPEAQAKPGQGIMGDLSVGGSRPAIFDGQPATGNIYAQARPPAIAATENYSPEALGQPPQSASDPAPGSGWGAIKRALTYNSDVEAAKQRGAAALTSGANYGNEGRSVPTPNSNPVVVPAVAKAEEKPAGGIMSMDLAGANASLARANAIRQQMIDSQPGGRGIIADTGRAESQALLDKWDGQSQVNQIAKMDPRQASAVAHLIGTNAQAETARRGQDIQQEAQAGSLGVAERDAGSRERTAAADVGLKSAQSQGIMADAESRLELLSLQQRAAKGDKAALETLMAMRGKSENYKDRYIPLPNRKVYNETGQIVGEEPGGIFDAAAGRPVQQVGGANQSGGVDVKVGMPVKAPDGTHTFKGKTITVKDGKVTGVA